MPTFKNLDFQKLGLVAITTGAYVLSARAGLELNAVNHFATLVWPPSAIALCAVVLWGYEFLPGVLLGAFLVNFWVGATPPMALALALGNTAEAAAAAWVLRERFEFDPMLRRLMDASILIVVAFTTTLIAATGGALSLWLSGAITQAQFSATWFAWWTGDALGILLFAPFLMRWLFKPFFSRTRVEAIEGAMLFFLLVGVNILISWMHVSAIAGVPTIYILLVPLIWAALRAGPRGMTFALAFTSVSAISAAVFNSGPTALDFNDEFLLMVFLGVINILFLLFVSIVEERKEAVVALRGQIHKLDEVIDRLRISDETKSEFIATLAHELRNPLSPIVSSLELLRQKEILPQNNELITTIEAHTMTIARLLDDLLDVTRITRKRFKLRKETIELHAVIKRSAETVASFYTSRRHALMLDLPQQDVWLLADPVRLEQIFVNLLFNAGKYTEPGGTVALSVRVNGAQLRASVRDTGIGIEPEMTEKIFEPFFQAKSGGGRLGAGLGLGLALTKRLVELHGGTVVARSAGLGHGSEFIVEIPIPPSIQLPFELPKTEAAALRGGTQRVLVVDDNEAAANSLGALLRGGGHEVELAYSGEAALAVAKRAAPTAILLDIGLPDMDGYEVARRLRQETPGPLFIVALTGYGQDSDKERARKAGFDHHLTKPVMIADVERLLLRARRATKSTA